MIYDAGTHHWTLLFNGQKPIIGHCCLTGICFWCKSDLNLNKIEQMNFVNVMYVSIKQENISIYENVWDFLLIERLPLKNVRGQNYDNKVNV